MAVNRARPCYRAGGAIWNESALASGKEAISDLSLAGTGFSMRKTATRFDPALSFRTKRIPRYLSAAGVTSGYFRLFRIISMSTGKVGLRLTHRASTDVRRLAGTGHVGTCTDTIMTVRAMTAAAPILMGAWDSVGNDSSRDRLSSRQRENLK